MIVFPVNTPLTGGYPNVKLPVRDGDGFHIQRSGVTDVPGLYFVGLPWMPSEKSGFLIGVGDAADISRPTSPRPMPIVAARRSRHEVPPAFLTTAI